MCGIAGFVNLKGHNPEEEKHRLCQMAHLLAHRGPDEEGFFVDSKIAFGHRRLAIIDLSSGKQPMVDDEAGLIIVFNGEIYNFLELRRELESLGEKFLTNSDTEVILKAYRVWGLRCLERLFGMFAFAIWDFSKQQLFLARDRLGKKPLYYWYQNHFLAFASELKSLLTLGAPKEISPEALDCYFSFGYVPSPQSIFKSIKKLPPANYLLFGEKGVTIKRYWNLAFEPQEYHLDKALEEFFALFEQAVKIRLISEVPLGAFLSGGIDSPLVVAQMQKILSQPVLTNSIGFDDQSHNELPLARKIADYLGTDHHEFVVTPRIREILPKVSWYLDEPLADSSVIPTYYVCKMARQNVTVSLSGDGGDESFAGYTFRYLPHLWECLLRKKIPIEIRTILFGLLGQFYPRSSNLPKFLRLKTIFQNLAVSDAKAFYRDLVWLPPEIRDSLYTDSFLKGLCGFTPYEFIHPLYKEVEHLDPVSRCQYIDLHFYLPENVLVKVDRMSMAVSLEVRSPLLDHRLVEFAAKLPLNLKVSAKQGKILLREAIKHYLPPEFITKIKQGFSVPEADWLRGGLRPFVERLLQKNDSILWVYLNRPLCQKLWERHLSAREDHGVFFWGLMMFSFWEEHYLQGGE